MLTAFVIGEPCSDCKPDLTRAVRSLEPVAKKIHICPPFPKATDVIYEMTKTDWFLFIHVDEWLDDQLVEALPVFMEAKFDCYSLYKRILGEGDPQYFIYPRMFRKGFPLKYNGQPGKSLFEHEVILDGWLRANDASC